MGMRSNRTGWGRGRRDRGSTDGRFGTLPSILLSVVSTTVAVCFQLFCSLDADVSVEAVERILPFRFILNCSGLYGFRLDGRFVVSSENKVTDDRVP